MNKSFALAVTLAATAFLTTGCADNSNCQNGTTPNGNVCNQSSGSGSGGSGSFFHSNSSGEKGSGGFGDGHGGGGAGEAGG